MTLAEVGANVTEASGKSMTGFRNRFHSISEFRTDEMQKAKAFSGFGVFSSSPDALTRQELDSFVDDKKEPTKVTKAQIKEYAKKYGSFQPEDKKETKEPAPWYR